MPNYKIGIELDADDNASGDLKKVAGAMDAVDAAAVKGGKDVGGMGASLGGLVSPAGLALGAVTAIGGAMVAVGAHAMGLASEVEQSTALMTTQLALTDEEAGRFEETMRAIYANNFGESFEDIASSLTTVEQGFERIGGLAPEQLQKVTEDALAMRDAFEYEVGDTVGATATLMENFGLTSTQAMDFLVAAQQRGLNSSGDLLETIGEYSVQFSEGGATAGEFFDILEEGNAGGVLGTDKAADAFKEFGIRILDDSETTKTALSDIGLSYDTLKQGFADGSITTIDAMQLVIDKINEIEDPVERAKAGVALFGTQWEDLGESGVLALGNVEDALGETEGASKSLGTQYDTDAAKLASATRLWDDALVDVGVELNGLAAEALPLLAQAMTDYIVPAIGHFADWLAAMREGEGYLQKYQQNYGGYDMTLRDNPTPIPVTPEPQAQSQSVGATTSNSMQATINVYGNASASDVEEGVLNAGRRMGMR